MTTNQKSSISASQPLSKLNGDHWQPAPGLSFQWQLSDLPVDASIPAEVYEIDGLDNEKTVVDNLHVKGHKVVCYVDVGSWENFRTDQAEFPASVLGTAYQGYPDERWLDIRQLTKLAPILGKRFDTCRDKGFDAIEGDNVDGFEQDSGFPLTAADQLTFNRWFAEEVHKRGLAVALKNDAGQASELVKDFDFVVTEECVLQGNCDDYRPFRLAGKLHVNAEYTDTAITLTQMCAEVHKTGLTSVLKHRSLDAFRQACS